MARPTGVLFARGSEETRTRQQRRETSSSSHYALNYERWSSMRCKQMQKWIQKWAPHDLYGGIPLQGTDTASAPVAISVSKATMAMQKLVGASLDYTACFDNIDAELCLLILLRLGLPKEIANASRALYSQLKCIVKWVWLQVTDGHQSMVSYRDVQCLQHC